MGRSERSLVACLLIACSACASTPRGSPAILPEAVEISDSLYRACDPPRSGPGVAHCSIDGLASVDLGILGLGQALAHEQAETRALRQTGALDLRAALAQAEALQEQLDSPWRSWWLWSLAGGIVTAVTLTAVYWTR